MKTIMLIIPLLVLAGCFGGGEASSLDTAKKRLEELSAEVRILEEERSALRKEKSALKSKLPKKLSSKNSKSIGEQTPSYIAAADYLEKVESGLGQVESELEAWRGPVRKTFEGMPLRGLEMVGGEVIPKTKVIEVLDETLKVEIDGGTREIRWSDLSEKNRLSFVHEESVLETFKN